MATEPFKIHIPDHKLERLRQKLALSEYPEDIPTDTESSWDQGPPVAEIKRLAQVWQTSYDWRKAEVRLNTFPHYLTSVNIDGFGTYKLHHTHKRSSRSDAIPLLFLHGWPGSFLEVTKIIDDLVQGTPDGPAFHVIAPSLVDFGFSSASRSKKFGMDQHAEAYDKLMLKLGYNQYVIQAGDVGGLVSRFMAKNYGPTRCRACHTNTPAPSEPDATTHPDLHAKIQSTPISEVEQKGLARVAEFSKEGSGYYKQQSTKPVTIGYSLRDSPIGLLAWLYEKLHDWSDNYNWTDDEILTWVSIYYFSTPGPEASSNVYYTFEHSQPPSFAAAAVYVDVPHGISTFANDLMVLPRLWNHSLSPIVFESLHETGGHFAAWERADAIISDLQKMFGKDGGAYNITQTIVSSKET